MERVQKIIASSGYCSRRKAEEYIVSGKVRVNGEVVKELGSKARYDDVITVCGEEIKKESKEYILLYKPRGVISSAQDDKGRKTVIDVVKSDKRLYPVGRLDYDTSGVLLLTNDGELTNRIIHPSSEIERVYVVKVDEAVIPVRIKKLLKGVIWEGVKYKADKVKIIKIDKKNNKSIISVTVHEGKYHHIKNMFKAIGYEVSSLKRERFGFLDLRGLKSGEYRYLSLKEVKRLYSITK